MSSHWEGVKLRAALRGSTLYTADDEMNLLELGLLPVWDDEDAVRARCVDMQMQQPTAYERRTA